MNVTIHIHSSVTETWTNSIKVTDRIIDNSITYSMEFFSNREQHEKDDFDEMVQILVNHGYIENIHFECVMNYGCLSDGKNVFEINTDNETEVRRLVCKDILNLFNEFRNNKLIKNKNYIDR